MFLPSKTTSVLQPMDQGVIRNFKTYCRQMMIHRLLINNAQRNLDLKDVKVFGSFEYDENCLVTP